MKIKLTKKSVKEMGNPVYCIGYCELQNLLRFVDPFAYSTRSEGWACDYYYINGVIISTGYSPIGRKADRNLCQEYDQKAREIICDSSLLLEEEQAKLELLINEFVGKLTA